MDVRVSWALGMLAYRSLAISFPLAVVSLLGEDIEDTAREREARTGIHEAENRKGRGGCGYAAARNPAK